MRLGQKCLRYRQTIHLRDVLYADAYIKKTEIIILMNIFVICVDIVQMMTELGNESFALGLECVNGEINPHFSKN